MDKDSSSNDDGGEDQSNNNQDDNDVKQHLMALFQPPPPTPANTINAPATPANTINAPAGGGKPAPAAGSGAEALLSMFSEPAPRGAQSSSAATSTAEGSSMNHQLPNYGTVSSSESQSPPPSPPAAGGAVSLMSMFQPPPNQSAGVSLPETLPPPVPFQHERSSTLKIGNHRLQQQQQPPPSAMMMYDDKTPKISQKAYALNSNDSELKSLLAPPSLSRDNSKEDDDFSSKDKLEPVEKVEPETIIISSNNKWESFRQTHLTPSTMIGSVMFLLYHIVFVLAMSSAITRPSSDKPVLGVMAKLSTVGIIVAGPVFIARLGKDVPAIYPTVDLFLAPFFARASQQCDQALLQQGIHSDTVFFSTFAMLTAIGMFFAGGLLVLAAKFKLANLGSYLPYSVLCGFFSAVGFLLWALSFNVDTNGKKWQYVFFSGDWNLIVHSLKHHLPSLSIGILMNRLGPKHPFYVMALVCCTLVVFYAVLFVSGYSLEQAQKDQWFWSEHELVYDEEHKIGFGSWDEEPAPFAQIFAVFKGTVHWSTVYDGIGEMFALALLYLLRTSIHASALKKNVANLVYKERVHRTTESSTEDAPRIEEEPATTYDMATSMADALSERIKLVQDSLDPSQPKLPRRTMRVRSHSEIDIEVPLNDTMPKIAENGDLPVEFHETRPPPCRLSLQEIFLEYGYTLLVSAVVGGFAVCPTISCSNTMYAIGAGGPAPQYGCVVLLAFFYLTSFSIVRFIPKAVFSSLLVLGAVDTFMVWFFLSYRKTQSIWEWLVVPFIVLLSLIVGFLNAVIVGIGISMFVFVGNFFRVGVVKFNATGLEIRSTVERSPNLQEWLDTHGDLIQVMVLQNYLFFGNASSILAYISTMFEDIIDIIEHEGDESDLPPKPKVLIVDLSLVTGMDTSTVDIFADIKQLCKTNGCKLFLCGLSPRDRKGLALGGIKPESGFRSARLVRFFSDLDSALGKAEDELTFNMEVDTQEEQKSKRLSQGNESGFRYALKQIDEQHGQEFCVGLVELEKYTTPIRLQPGDPLFEEDGGVIEEKDRGLVFIESGMLKIERDTGNTMTRGRSTLTRSRNSNTLNNLHARAGSVGQKIAAIKAGAGRDSQSRTFRLARIGPGWVCGTIEGATGVKTPGCPIAVSQCRLHFIPFSKIEELEKKDPVLVLRLHKMLTYLMAQRQEITIEQLATIYSIVSSPAHSKPLSRAAMRAFRR